MLVPFPMKALVLSGVGEPATADHPYLRQTAAAGREQVGSLLWLGGGPRCITDVGIVVGNTGARTRVLGSYVGPFTPVAANARRYCESSGAPWDMVEAVADCKGHDRRYSLDDSLPRHMGYAPRIPFLDGLKDTVCWYQANRRWWYGSNGRHLPSRTVSVPPVRGSRASQIS